MKFITSDLKMGAITRSWASWMGIISLTIVCGGKQESMVLNLVIQAQTLSIALKGSMGTIAKFVVNQEWITSSKQGYGWRIRVALP